MPVDNHNRVNAVAEHRLDNIINHLRHRIILQGQRKGEGIVMAAVSDRDRRQYEHIAELVRDRLPQLIGNDRITPFSQMLAMCFTGADSKHSLFKIPLFYLMGCHFPQLIQHDNSSFVFIMQAAR